MTFTPGDLVYAQNPKYRDGTRLRAAGEVDAPFNGVWCPNDVRLEILDVATHFLKVEKPDGQVGWIRERNLSRVARVPGVTKPIVTTEIVTPDPEYVRGIKIYNVGIKEDPIPGQKFGKGVQHLISSPWLAAMSEFVAVHLPAMQAFARHAREGAALEPGYDFVYFTNMASTLFGRAEQHGLRTQEAMDQFLMATWLVMAAAEVDDFPFMKYSPNERAAQREAFYAMYLAPRPGPGNVAVARDDAAALGMFAAPLARRDLLPPIALERLGLNNELSALKYSDPGQSLREGFQLSTRIDSLKRHFEGVHRRLVDEDHVIHLLWNFHAIYHVAVVFPDKNDLAEVGAARGQPRARYEPTTSLHKIERSALPPSAVHKLDWNEGAIPPPPEVTAALIAYVQAASGAYLKWYPHLAGGDELRAKLAAYAGVIEENLVITNGSDDALILLCQAFLGPGKSALAPVPTYEHFCVDAVGTGAELVRLELPDPFVADRAVLTRGIERHKPDVVYLVSPNNPTGSQWSPADVRDLASRFADVTFVVDEAYHEFATIDPATGKPSTCAPLAIELRNVIVTRTFSKAFCLAAVRCGYAIAHPTTIDRLRAYYNPKSVNQFAQIAALHALGAHASYYAPYIARTNEARDAFVRDLAAHGVVVRSGGGGNFACVQVPGNRTAELCRRLEAHAIYVRDISGRFPGFVRITIGLDMARVAAAVIAELTAIGGAA